MQGILRQRLDCLELLLLVSVCCTKASGHEAETGCRQGSTRGMGCLALCAWFSEVTGYVGSRLCVAFGTMQGSGFNFVSAQIEKPLSALSTRTRRGLLFGIAAPGAQAVAFDHLSRGVCCWQPPYEPWSKFLKQSLVALSNGPYRIPI